MTDTQRATSNRSNSGTADSAAKKPARTAKARQAVKSTIETGKAKARESADRVRAKASEALDSSVEVIDNSPLTAIAGALAVGAVAAALIPATRQELETVGPLGIRVKGALDQAFTAAKSAGAEHLTAQGLTSTALSTGLGGIVGGILKAALAASSAANAQTKPTEASGMRANGGPTPETV